MRDMSRAIRHELSEYGPTLQDIPTETLGEFVTITGAVYADLRNELGKRSDVEEDVDG